MQNFTDRATLDNHRMTSDGYLIASARCARTGVQMYHASDIGLDGDRLVGVYRPESAVMDVVNSWPSYVGKPVTVNHPPVMVDAENWKEHAVGDILDEIARDGETVVVPIRLMDAAAIRQVQNGIREVSMGYTTNVEIRDGVAPDGTPYQAVQTGPILINHLAIVPRARGGSQLRIGDSADKWGASPLTDAELKGVQMPDLLKIMVDGLQVETTDAGAKAINKLTDTIAARDAAIAGAVKAHQDALDAKDAEIAAKDATISKMEAGKLTDGDIDNRVAARADLIGKAHSVADGLETSGLTDADIRKAAVVKALGDDAIAGKGQAYIDARFDILVEDAAKADPVQKMKGSPPVKLTTLDAAYRERNTALEGAWKKGVA